MKSVLFTTSNSGVVVDRPRRAVREAQPTAKADRQMAARLSCFISFGGTICRSLSYYVERPLNRLSEGRSWE